MNRGPLISLLILAAGAVPAAHADARQLPNKAYFKVKISAGQHITWKRDQTTAGTPTCGPVHIIGGGESDFGMSSQWQPVTVKRLPGNQVRFSYAGTGSPEIPVNGSLNRHGDQSATGSGPTSGCSKPIPAAPDCGEHELPPGSTIGLEWRTPADWADTGGPAPLVQSLSVIGPVVPNGGSGMTYQNCLGAPYDYMLGVSDGTSGYDSGFGGLPKSELFGRRRHFDVSGVLNKHTKNANPPGVTGTNETNTSTNWKVRFVRLAHPGRRPEPIHPAPLS